VFKLTVGQQSQLDSGQRWLRDRTFLVETFATSTNIVIHIISVYVYLLLGFEVVR